MTFEQHRALRAAHGPALADVVLDLAARLAAATRRGAAAGNLADLVAWWAEHGATADTDQVADLVTRYPVRPAPAVPAPPVKEATA